MRVIRECQVVCVHTVKTYRGRGCTVPFFLNLDTLWEWVSSFTLRSLCPLQRIPGIHWIRGWVGPIAGPELWKERKVPCHLQAGRPAGWRQSEPVFGAPLLRLPINAGRLGFVGEGCGKSCIYRNRIAFEWRRKKAFRKCNFVPLQSWTVHNHSYTDCTVTAKTFFGQLISNYPWRSIKMTNQPKDVVAYKIL